MTSVPWELPVQPHGSDAEIEHWGTVVLAVDDDCWGDTGNDVVVVEFVMGAACLVVTSTRYPVPALMTAITITSVAITQFLMSSKVSLVVLTPTHENNIVSLMTIREC